MTELDDDGDPLLVRPYILGDQRVPAPRASAETWPESAAEPQATGPAPADATVPIAVSGHRARRPQLRPWMLALAGVLVLVLLGATGLVLSLRSGPSTPRALPPDLPLPSLVEPATATGTGTADPPGNPPPAEVPRARATSSPAATPPTGATATATPTRKTSTATPRATTPPAGLAPAVPAVARVGRIGGKGGLCLDLNGGVATDFNHVQVFTCNGTPAQVWTMATDGTLRVVGKCAQVVEDGTVHITGCDSRLGSQWRAGASRSLINVLTGTCLTDQAGGTRPGAGVRVNDCEGSDNQAWDLP